MLNLWLLVLAFLVALIVAHFFENHLSQQKKQRTVNAEKRKPSQPEPTKVKRPEQTQTQPGQTEQTIVKPPERSLELEQKIFYLRDTLHQTPKKPVNVFASEGSLFDDLVDNPYNKEALYKFEPVE